jgi:uncharacterized membrane protein
MQTQGILPLILPVHILAGSLGLISGYVALSAAKGATPHRKSGMLFVVVMTAMAITGMLISAAGNVAPAINIPSALLTFYLVITSLMTVRTPTTWSRPTEIAAMLMALALGLACFALAIAAVAGGGPGAGMAYPLVMFGGVSLAASAGDLRVLRAGGVRGTARLSRHLWRMCFALFIASIAFFLGPDRVPEAIRTPALRATGVLLPIVSMFYWLWRIRARGTRSSIAKRKRFELSLEVNPKGHAS